MITCVIVAGSADLFSLRVEPSHHTIVYITFLSNAAANPDELLSADDWRRGLQTELHLLVSGVPVAALRAVKRQRVASSSQTQRLRRISSSLYKSDLRPLGRSGVAAGERTIVSGDA